MTFVYLLTHFNEALLRYFFLIFRVMEVSIKDKDGIGKGIGGVTGGQHRVIQTVMFEVQLSDTIHDSADLLRFPSEEEVACKKSHELFQVMLTALFQDNLHVGLKELCRTLVISGEDIDHGPLI